VRHRSRRESSPFDISLAQNVSRQPTLAGVQNGVVETLTLETQFDDHSLEVSRRHVACDAGNEPLEQGDAVDQGKGVGRVDELSQDRATLCPV